MPKKDSKIHLRPIGDVHVGNAGFDRKEFEKQIRNIERSERTHTIGMGDYIDNIQAWAKGTIDKRYDPESMERDRMTTDEQIAYFVGQWKKVAHKSIGMLSGNHEWKTITRQRFVKDFCNPIDMASVMEDVDGVKSMSYEPVVNPETGRPNVLYHNKYLGYAAYINIAFKFENQLIKNYLIFAHHGGYSGMHTGGAVNRLQALSAAFDFDVALMGHTHDTFVVSQVFTRYNLKHNVPVESKQIIANTGTFLRGYMKNTDGYIEINPRRPKRVGTVTLTFVPYTGDLYGHD